MDDRTPHPRRAPRSNAGRMQIDGRPPQRRSAARPQDPAHAGSARHAPTSNRHDRSRRSGAASNSATPRPRSEGTRSDRAASEAPSWYDPASARGSRTPRPTLDASLDNPRWRSSSTSDVYVGGRGPRKRSSRLPLIVGGIVLVVVIVALAVNLIGALTAPQPEEQPAEDPAVAEATPQPTTLTISFAGDCTLGTDEGFNQNTSFNARYDAVDDPGWFFSNVADIFNQDDLTVANMEGTLTESTTRADKTFAFKGPADYAQVLVQGGVETASLANNHSHDYGDASYTDTIEALEAAGLGTFGYDRIDYRDVNGVKVALIGTYELAEGLDIQDELKQNIQTAKDQGAQITIVYFHWGVEKETVPNETQVELGHIAVDSGADLVIGSHPHVIQGYEKYNGRYIVYSLGNFCFGGNSHPSDTDCMIFQQTFTVTGNDVATDDAITVIPCSISSSADSNNYQPTPAEGDEKTRIEKKIQASNDAIADVSKAVSGSASDADDTSQPES